MDERFWEKVEEKIRQQETYILTGEERKSIAEAEQRAYEEHVETIRQIIEEFEERLKERGFSTSLHLNTNGFKFTYSKTGYYGPAGFRTDFHVDGPLVLAQLNPAGDPNAFITNNDLDMNFEIGTNFDADKFKDFLKANLINFLGPRNLITTEERRERLRAIQRNKSDN